MQLTDGTDLTELSHVDRQRALATTGRQAASGDLAARARLTALSADPNPWQRWLALIGLAAAGDSAALRVATRDASQLVRGRAWSLLRRSSRTSRSRGPADFATALRQDADTRWAPRIAAAALAKSGCSALPEIEAVVVEFASPDRPHWLDALALCSEPVVRAALPMLDEHGSPSAWHRLARRHPRLVSAHLGEAARKRHDSRLIWRLQAVMDRLAEADPDAALDLVESLFASEGQATTIRSALKRLARLRPERTFDLLRARQAMGLPAPLSGLFSLVHFPEAERLGLERLKWAVSQAPACLPDGSDGRTFVHRLSPTDRAAFVTHWLSHGVGSWGAFLFAYAAPGELALRDRAWHRWSTAARNPEGVIGASRLDDLPRALREREARRHLGSVVWLTSRPELRRDYARLLPYAEAETVLDPWLRHPEGAERAAGLLLLLASVRHDRTAAPDAVAAVRRRKNEQDPVRLGMLQALADLPPSRFPDPCVAELTAIVGEALDAADLSGATARQTQRLAARVLSRDPSAGLSLVGRILRVRGSVDGGALTEGLTTAEARRLDPVLASVVSTWVERERAGATLGLTFALGPKLRHMPETLTAIEGLCHSPHLLVLASWLDLLARFDRPRFRRCALDLFAADRSSVCLPRIARLLATRRTDLLDPLLDGQPMTGRFATGRTHWVLDLGLRLSGLTPAQQVRYARGLRGLLDEGERDVPTCRWAISRLAALPFVPPDALVRYAADSRIPVRDIALRALPSLDGGEGLDALLDCMGDDRARIAAYALRRCLQQLGRAEALARLAQLPMDRVTVAKEVLRHMGELGGPAARDSLIQIGQTGQNAARPLHRDVRIALLRALWDHIEFPPAWALLEAAARDPDPVLAGRLLSIPMNRLSRAADARLAALFGDVLSRPEAEARLGFLSAVTHAPLRDESRVLFGRLLQHLGTPDPAEAVQALTAVLARMRYGDPAETKTVAARLVELLPRRQQADALLRQLAAVLHAWAPEHHRSVARTVEAALEKDRWAALPAIRLLAKTTDAGGFADGLVRLNTSGYLHHDAVAGALTALGTLAAPDTLARRLADSPEPRLRRIALGALLVAAAPENGWIPERRALLVRFQKDESMEVAASAAWVFPPEA